MKKSKLSIIVLSALLIAGVAVVKNQNCKSIVYNNVEALTGGDNGNEPQTHQVCRYTKGITQNEPSWFFKKDKDGKEVPMWENVGTVKEVDNPETEATHILKWTITAEEAWENAGKEIVHYVAYENAEQPKLRAVIKLVANVEDFLKAYNVPTADYIPRFWKNEPEKNITYYNVFTPDTGETDPSKCIFQTDLNISFSTWLTTDVDKKGKQLGTVGSLKLPEDPNGAITAVDYFFCTEDVEKIAKIGDLKVQFLVGSKLNEEAYAKDKDANAKTYLDSTELYARFDAKEAFELVAKIKNEAATIVNGQQALNFIEVNKQSEVAKKLVNTDKLYTFISAKGFVCGDEEKARSLKK